MKIIEAWEKGFAGKGVVVTVVDDGLDYRHPDLINNYVRKIYCNTTNHIHSKALQISML